MTRLKTFRYYPELILFASLIVCILHLDLSYLGPHPGNAFQNLFHVDFQLPHFLFYTLSHSFWILTQSVEGLLFLKIVVSIICIYALLKELKNEHSILFVTLFCSQFLFNPLLIDELRSFTPDSMITCFTTLIFFVALKYDDTEKPVWISFATLICSVGVQFHIAVLIPYLAFLFALAIRKQHLRTVTLQLFLVLVMVYLAVRTNNQLRSPWLEYHPNGLISNLRNLALNLQAADIHSPYFRLAHVATRLGWLPEPLGREVIPFLNITYLILVCSMITFLLASAKRMKLDFLKLFGMAWLFQFLFLNIWFSIPVTILMPIAFYFLILVYFTVEPYLKRGRVFFILFFITASVLNLYFILDVYTIQNRLARNFHAANDHLELNLKTKKMIYSLNPPSPLSRDPFSGLHGRAINKMRAEEMNPPQSRSDFGLYKAITNLDVVYDYKTKELKPDSSWLFQLRSLDEMSLHPLEPFLMTEVKTNSLPQNLVIKYLNDSLEGIYKTDWANSSLILPLAFLKQTEFPKVIHLEFDLISLEDHYLNLLFEAENYKVLLVKIDGKVVNSLESYSGQPGVQNQLIYPLLKKSEIQKVIVDLKIESAIVPNYSRIDLFTNAYVLPPEELR